MIIVPDIHGRQFWRHIAQEYVSKEHIVFPGYYQVFGHTMLPTPLITPYFACLDCQTAFRIDESGCMAIL